MAKPRSAGHKELGTPSEQGAVEAEISREIVKVYAEVYGRGPSKVKTRRREGLVVCLLEEVFGRAEQVLVDSGHFEQVRGNRQVVRGQIEPRVRAVVEEATGSQVTVCVGQVIETGTACEVCLLATAPTPAGLQDRDPPRSPPRG